MKIALSGQNKRNDSTEENNRSQQPEKTHEYVVFSGCHFVKT